jgi:hypothetical protein
VLVVSNIGLDEDLPTMKPAAFLNSSTKDFTLNLNIDYRYLKTAYYVSMHAEVLGNRVIPTTENIIDASRTPLLLLKASKAGIPTLPYLVTSSVKQIVAGYGFPVVVFAVNPFCYDGFKTAQNKSALYRAVKSLSMNYKFSVCVQPLRGEMQTVKSFFGKTETDGAAGKIAERVYEVFNLPICKLHIQLVGSEAYLCGLQPLKTEEVAAADLKLVSTEVSRILNKGEHPVG